MKRWSFVTDLHGDLQDRTAVKLCKAHLDSYGPDHRIFGGDLFDFTAWRRGASEADKRRRMRKDWEAGMDFIRWYQPTALLLGNHDVRMWDQVENDGPMADLCEEKIAELEEFCRKLQCRILPYCKRRGVYHLGRMKFAHGFFCGVSSARQMAHAYGSILFGHGHSIDVASTASDHRRAARMVGCLCRLDMVYNRAHVNALRQAHGWAYGPLMKDGTYQVFQAEVIFGKVVVAQDIDVLSARNI